MNQIGASAWLPRTKVPEALPQQGLGEAEGIVELAGQLDCFAGARDRPNRRAERPEIPRREGDRDDAGIVQRHADKPVVLSGVVEGSRRLAVGKR